MFRPAILGTRWGTAGIGLVLAAAGNRDNDLVTAAWSFVIVGYCLYRTLRPLTFREDVGGLLAILADVAIHVITVDATGYWQSPFVVLDHRDHHRGVRPRVRVRVPDGGRLGAGRRDPGQRVGQQRSSA